MNNLKISLVTSCYNAGPYLEETFESIINQTYQDWEWTLIDDFSQDDTKQKIEEICSRDVRIKTMTAETKKQYWWNPQYAATGDVFAHLDADDKLLPNTFNHINYYFNKFPDVFFIHFYANKFSDVLPNNETEFVNNFHENVYISNDNDSFLEGFEKLTPTRTDIFGCLRVIKNLKGLHFPVHEDGDACSSNDGQWCLVAEEYGKWMTIPRTVYLIRRRMGSEQFTKWNKRGEAKLIHEAQERRKNLILEQPRNIKYFDEIHSLAESVYTNTLNYQTERKTISFINFNFEETKKQKTKTLFYDHNIVFDDYEKCEYYVINYRMENEPSEIISLLSKIKNKSKITVFCYNTHLMHNNKTGKDFVQELCDELNKKGYQYFFNLQKNRFFAIFDNINVSEESVSANSSEHELIEELEVDEKIENIDIEIKTDDFNILHITPENTDVLKNKIINDIMISESRAGNEVSMKKYIDITQNDLQKFDVIVNHDIQLNKKLKELYIPFMTVVHENDELNENLLKNSLINVSYKQNLKKDLDLKHFNIGVYKEKYFTKDVRNTKFVFPNVPKLICVERNIEKSYAHLVLIAAREMHLPILLITPNPNKNCEQYKTIQLALKDFDTEHDQVEYLTEVTDEELNDLYNDNHFFISLNENYMSYDLLNALSTGMVCLGITGDKNMPGVVPINPSKKSIVNELRSLIREGQYEHISSIGLNFSKQNSWDFAFERNKNNYQDFIQLKNNVPLSMKDRLIDVYENSEHKSVNEIETISPTLSVNMREGNPIVILSCEKGKKYNVVFKNQKTGEIPFSTVLPNNHWAAVNEKYFIPWLIYVENIENGEVVFEYDLLKEIQTRKTHVYFDSDSIGDNMAWIPAVEEFRKTYEIQNLTCATFFNNLFEQNYSDISFIEPNTGFDDFEIQYRIPWLEKGQFSPLDCRETSLQNICASILGCDGMTEVPAKITVKEKETLLKKPYVAIGMQSTAQAKYWNNPGAWQKLTDYIQKKGYDVVFVDKHEHFGKDPHMNSNPPNALKRNERTLDQTIATLAGSEFFIGIGSGLSWISWALNKEVILISGFSQPFAEFQTKCTRIINTDVCHGCYNRVKLDPSNWTWCPDHEGTDRMFECTKNISVETVCDAVDNVIQKLTND